MTPAIPEYVTRVRAGSGHSTGNRCDAEPAHLDRGNPCLPPDRERPRSEKNLQAHGTRRDHRQTSHRLNNNALNVQPFEKGREARHRLLAGRSPSNARVTGIAPVDLGIEPGH